ncbi:hypothetical protein C7212DRAFT_342381 [Tuber magnatum]|uniref:Uncharacterized protein n=1 Tax=Tuber magnatum TaxID=42249 RepID=A0A317SUA8_9PEZI|nr:hypothetical protein C7212DRAFT_342381 [Tuber magnatum]
MIPIHSHSSQRKSLARRLRFRMLEDLRLRQGHRSRGNSQNGPKRLSAGTLRPSSRLVSSGKSLRLVLFLLLVSTPVPATAKTDFVQCGAHVKELAKNNSLPPEDIYTGPVKGPLGQAQNNENPALLLTFAACEKHCGSAPAFYKWEKASDTVTTWVLPLVGLVLQAPFESNNPRQTMFLVFRWVGSPIASMMYILWNMRVTRKCAIMVDRSIGVNERPRQASSFAALRDSLYLLSVMNQYELNICPRLPEHRIEAILRIGLFDSRPEIQRIRGRVAARIRRERCRGTVQILASLGWFLVAMAISIHRAFGDLGKNTTAHNLALGLLVCWLPVLIAATAVDRNPMDAHHVRTKLNRYLREIAVTEHIPGAFPGVAEPNIFGEFAGQGRIRWHHGAAHSMLRTLEAMPEMGRGWLEIYANTNWLTRNTYSPLLRFDSSQGLQMIASFLIVCSSSIGAFIVSYFTPTVGLGCRSGGYTIFGINAFGCLLMEMSAWVFLHPGKGRRVAQWVLRLCEFGNFCWLVYIIMAQTFGIYSSCRCMSSMWGGGTGYVNFESVQYFKSYGIERSWFLGTSITCVVSGIGILYVVEQWCTQSFLWTQDWDSAMNGLQQMRRWKRATAGPRWVFALVAACIVKAGCWVRSIFRREGLGGS